jgi:hypothetical protein
MGAIFHLMMDITVHWGVLRYLHEDVGANRAVLGTAISLVSIMIVIVLERFHLRRLRATGEQDLPE